jgi:hypothetical protein
MPNIMTRVCFVFVLVAMGSGCVTERVSLQQPDPVPSSRLPKVTSHSAVALIALRGSENPDVVIGGRTSVGGLVEHDFTVRLDEFTNATVKGLENALRRMDVIVDPNADKKVTVQATKAGPEAGWVDARFVLTIKVQAGDRMRREFTSAPRFGVDEDPIGSAINNNVLSVVNNRAFQEFLEN